MELTREYIKRLKSITYREYVGRVREFPNAPPYRYVSKEGKLREVRLEPFKVDFDSACNIARSVRAIARKLEREGLA